MLITAKELTASDACHSQVEIFRREWPEGAEVTLANCHRAVELGLSVGWAAEHLTTARAWKAYKDATAAALFMALTRMEYA